MTGTAPVEPTPDEEAQASFNELLTESIPTPPGIEEEVSALLEQRFPETPADEPVVETSEPAPEVSTTIPPPEPLPEPTPSTAPSPPDHLVLDDGTIVSREEATSYAAFERFLNDNPDISQAITATINQRTQPTPPDNVDLEDPTVQYLLQQNEAVRQQLLEATQLLQRHDYQLNTQTEVNSAAIVEQGVKSFQATHSLTDADIATIRQQAASLNILPGLITSGLSPNDAVQKSLDIAYWSIEDYRNRETQRQYDLNRSDQEKKSKLASLGGASGAISREPPAPTTKEEIKAAMIREVAEHMGVPPSQS